MINTQHPKTPNDNLTQDSTVLLSTSLFHPPPCTTSETKNLRSFFKNVSFRSLPSGQGWTFIKQHQLHSWSEMHISRILKNRHLGTQHGSDETDFTNQNNLLFLHIFTHYMFHIHGLHYECWTSLLTSHVLTQHTQYRNVVVVPQQLMPGDYCISLLAHHVSE